MRRTGSRLAGAALVLIMAICPVSSRVRCPSDLTLRFDLADGASSTGTPCVRHDGSVTVIVERVNPFLYDVEINGQVFHANLALPPAFEPLDPPSLPQGDATGMFGSTVGGYAMVVRDLYLAADELERGIRSALYGSSTPSPERLRDDALDVVQTWLDIREGDPTAAANQVMVAAHDAFQEADSLYGAVVDSFPAGPTENQRNTLRHAERSHRQLDRDRATILERFRSASEMLRQLGQVRFEAVSAPIVADGEDLRVRVTVTLRGELDAEVYPVAFELYEREVARVKTDGGFNIGASVGLMFSSPVDASYAVGTDSDDNPIIVRNGDEDVGSAGLGALLHVYQRKPGDVNHGPAVGLGINDGGGIQYFLGYGAILGRKHRVVFSSGGTLSAVDRLAAGLQEGDPPPSDGAIRTGKKLTLGFYVGVTYRFWFAGKRR